MTEQTEIKSQRLERIAALAGTGARVGVNYLKHYGRRAITGNADRAALDELNATEVFKTFSALKGGPLKLAQMLSIDQALLPPAYAKQFAQAQYSAPPLSYPLVVRTFRREFGKGPLDIFDTFEPSAARAASIGQVHRATLDGRKFAVKVQYPGVAESLRSDLAVVKPIALRLLGLREHDVAQYFKEVECRLLEETDYAQELKRSMELSSACAHLEGLVFPSYHPEFSSARILTMGWVDGIPLDVYADSDATDGERNKIGQALWDFYSHQIHELRLFHADPHPGNFLISGGKLCALDFGCTKAIDEDFYQKQFAFLNPAMAHDQTKLIEAMEAMDLLIEADGPEDRQKLIAICKKSVELLAKPFRSERFHFGDPEFMASIYELGQENRTNEALQGLRGQRGSAHSIYVNRAFFGLYSLLSRLNATVNIRLPAKWNF